jgi:hypothetical protein
VAASGEKGMAARMASAHSGMTIADVDKPVSDGIATARDWTLASMKSDWKPVFTPAR